MKLKILTYEYEVISEPGYSENRDGSNTPRNVGYIDYKRQTIKTDPEHGEDEQTLFHEIMHAADRFWYCNLTEEQVERLSEGLYHILKQNGVDLSPLYKEDSAKKEI
jgi:hypothetical protein